MRSTGPLHWLALAALAWSLAGCGTQESAVETGSSATTATASTPPTTEGSTTSAAPADPCTPPPGAPGTWEAPVHCLPGAPPHLPAPDAEILAVWHQPESECWPTCVFSGVFFDDGTLVWVDADGASAVPYDPAAALATLDTVTRADLVSGSAEDCMREADGLAPLLAVRGPSGWVVADRCRHVLDESHPLVALTEHVSVAKRASSPLVGAALVPDPGCDPTDVRACPRIEHELYESGLVLTYGDLPVAASPVPLAAHAAPRQIDPIIAALAAGPAPCFPGAVEPRPEDPVFQVETEPGMRCWIGPEGALVGHFAELVAALPGD